MLSEQYSKSLNKSPIVILTCCLVMAIATYRNSYGVDRAYIDSLLASPDFQAHEIAVDQLTTGLEVDTVDATTILLDALEREVANPTSYAMAARSYLTITGFIQHHHIRGLTRLGHIAVDSIYERFLSARTAMKARYIIALGLMKDSRVHDLLGPLYLESEDPFIRFKAISALRGYKDTLDIPIFVEALKDDYHVIASGYVNDTVTTRDYLISTEARLALRELGYKFR